MRTLGQIHLEDLEPHRFEDLVRQLLYDFRVWRSLEATGRSGSDGGFDARGREMTPANSLEQADQADEEGDEDFIGNEALRDERLWLIQCKREKAIGPAKARQYIAELAASFEREAPYGLVFAAACDLSRSTRDAIIDGGRVLGFLEIHVWAKGEIEDQLFQPRNDHLLFAYTGISLQIQRRSSRSALRSKLAAKRKLLRALKTARNILILEASDQRFPHPKGPEGGHWSERRHWNVYYPGRCGWDGLRVLLHRYWAVYDPETGHWDVAESTDTSIPGEHEDPWHEKADQQPSDAELWKFWQSQGTKQALYSKEAVLPYEAIIDVDTELDDFFEGITIYVDDFHPTDGPFKPTCYAFIEPSDKFAGWSPVGPDQDLRRRLFPRDQAGPEETSNDSEE